MVAEANDIPAEAATKQQWKVESIVDHRPDSRVPVDEMELMIRMSGSYPWSLYTVFVFQPHF